jgi:hypothetical protein
MAEVTTLNAAQIKAGFAELARREEDEKLDGYDVVLALESLRKDCGLTLGVAQRFLKAEREKLIAQPIRADSGQEEAAPDPAAIKAEYDAALGLCHDIATDPNLDRRLINTVEGLGVVGDRAGVLSSFYTAVSRLLRDPCGLVRKGSSASGKSYVVDKGILPLLNEDDRVKLTAASAKALFYSSLDFRHKLVFIPEAAALAATKGGGNDEFAMAVRELLSSGELDYHTVQQGEDGKLHGVHIKIRGPIAFIVTTARENLEEELSTRVIPTLADESDAQTERVPAAHARRAAGDGPEPVSDEELAKWRALQTCLRLGPREVVIPFATTIAMHTDRRQMRIRRDLPGVFSLIKAVALLHRYQRQTDAQGRIIAELRDYALALASLGEGLEDLTHGETSTLEAVRVAVSEALRELRRDWRRDLFMGAFRDALCRHLAGTGHMPVVERLGHARAAGRGDTVEECLAIVASAGASIDEATSRQLYRAAVVSSCRDARKLDAHRPAYVELSTYKLASLLGIGRHAARARIENAIEAGAVLDASPNDRPRTAPRLLAPGAPAKPKSTTRSGAFPHPSTVQATYRGGPTPRPSRPSGLVEG